MIRLPETQNALFQLDTDFHFRTGLHPTDSQRVSDYGLYIGHEDLDPNKHHDLALLDLSAIPLDDADLPQIERVMPFNRLGMNVMIYAGRAATAVSYLGEIDRSKRRMASEIGTSLASMRLMGDQARLLVIGNESDYSDLPFAEIADYSGTPAIAAAAIVERSLKSEINFLESDFVDLDPVVLPTVRPQNTIAIKFNHPLELELPAGKGRFALGGLKEVNTNNARELKETNDILLSRHHEVLRKLATKGILAISVIYDPSQPDGIDEPSFDSRLANAVNDLTRSRR